MGNYAIIKDNKVDNVIVVESHESITALPMFFPDADLIVEETELTGKAFMHGDFVDGKFRSVAPSPIWIWNEEESAWNPPVPAPQDDQVWWWEEESASWVLAPTDELEQ
jgi:hypothetical protein